MVANKKPGANKNNKRQKPNQTSEPKKSKGLLQSLRDAASSLVSGKTIQQPSQPNSVSQEQRQRLARARKTKTGTADSHGTAKINPKRPVNTMRQLQEEIEKLTIEYKETQNTSLTHRINTLQSKAIAMAHHYETRWHHSPSGKAGYPMVKNAADKLLAVARQDLAEFAEPQQTEHKKSIHDDSSLHIKALEKDNINLSNQEPMHDDELAKTFNFDQTPTPESLFTSEEDSTELHLTANQFPGKVTKSKQNEK